jgi:hypothetical protein
MSIIRTKPMRLFSLLILLAVYGLSACNPAAAVPKAGVTPTATPAPTVTPTPELTATPTLPELADLYAQGQAPYPANLTPDQQAAFDAALTKKLMAMPLSERKTRAQKEWTAGSIDCPTVVEYQSDDQGNVVEGPLHYYDGQTWQRMEQMYTPEGVPVPWGDTYYTGNPADMERFDALFKRKDQTRTISAGLAKKFAVEANSYKEDNMPMGENPQVLFLQFIPDNKAWRSVPRPTDGLYVNSGYLVIKKDGRVVVQKAEVHFWVNNYFLNLAGNSHDIAGGWLYIRKDLPPGLLGVMNADMAEGAYGTAMHPTFSTDPQLAEFIAQLMATAQKVGTCGRDDGKETDSCDLALDETDFFSSDIYLDLTPFSPAETANSN